MKKLLADQFSVPSLVRCDECCLDIAFKGYLFRVSLNRYHEHEVGPLSLERELVVPHFVCPLHHMNIHNLATVHPSYAGAVSLLTCWTHSHLFSDHISVETLELLVASVYMDGHAPGTASAGFLKALRLLAYHPWDSQPLFVNFADTSSHPLDAALLTLKETFDSMRRDNKHACRMYVIHPFPMFFPIP